MLQKFLCGVLIATSFSFYSCNGDEKKIESSSPSISTTQTQPVNNSIAQFEQKFENDSSNYELRTVLAVNYYATGALEKAAYHFRKIYEHDDKNLSALTNLGNIYYDSKKDNDAILFYEKALELDPNNIDMRCDLATCYLNINRHKKAIQILKENIKINPNHEKSHHNLAVILKQSGNAKESAEEMKLYERLKTATH